MSVGMDISISDEEQAQVQMTEREFASARQERSTFESHWEEIAQLIDTSQRGTFTWGSFVTPGEKNTDKQVDASGMVANSRFAAICDSLLTPRNMRWHGLAADDDYVMKDRQTRLWFEDTNKKLFKFRYHPFANFSAQNQGVYKSIGAYGTAGMFIEGYMGQHGEKALRYKNIPLGQLYLRENFQGLVDGFWRAFRVNAIQWKQRWPNRIPAKVKEALEKNSARLFDILHCVAPRSEGYDPDRLDYRGKPFRSYYISLDCRCMLYDPESGQSEGGYMSFPLAPSRYEQFSSDGPYGRGPAMMVLPALKTLNAEKRVFLKQGHRAADPVLLLADDGLADMSLRPGAMNANAVNSDGKPLVQVLPTGDIQITKEMMADEKSLINDTFLVTLFQILTDSPQMTATEVIERTNEKGILLAPTVGRQQSEYLGPMIDRELDLLSNLNLLLPMPPRLQEARGSYQVVYTSPLSRAMRAQEAAGFSRTLEIVKELVNITQDPSLLDPFDFDTAIPQIAEIQAVPESWMADDTKIAAKREGRAKRADQQAQIQAMPAQAAMIKAQAAVAKSGGGQPQQPGVPAGG